MKVEIKVSNYGDDRLYMPGTAHVFIDGREHAKLRSGEAFVITTSESFSTTTLLPPHKS